MSQPPVFRYCSQDDKDRDEHDTSTNKDFSAKISDEKHRNTSVYEDDLFDISTAFDCEVFGESIIVTPVKKQKNKEKSSNINKKRKIDSDNTNKKNKSNKTATEKKTVNTEKIVHLNDQIRKKSSSSKINSSDCNEGNNKTINKQQPQHVKNIETDNESKNKQTNEVNKGGFLDDILGKQDIFLHSSNPKANINEKKEENNNCQQSSQKKRPWSNPLKTSWNELTNPKNCPTNKGINYHYQLFSFGYEDQHMPCPSHGIDTPLKVIVRNKIHGITYKKKKNREPNETFLGRPDYRNSKPYILYPKLENQAYFGVEVNTLQEITQQWIELLVRPHTSLLQVIHCFNFTIKIIYWRVYLVSVLKLNRYRLYCN